MWFRWSPIGSGTNAATRPSHVRCGSSPARIVWNLALAPATANYAVVEPASPVPPLERAAIRLDVSPGGSHAFSLEDADGSPHADSALAGSFRPWTTTTGQAEW
jgi:hypothetical protein